MRADGGDWVYRDGIVIHEPTIHRGPIQVHSQDEMRDRLERRARRLGANAFAYVFIGLTIAGNWYLHLQPLMLLLAAGLGTFAAGLVALLVVHGVVCNRLLSSRTALPGIHERGVEPLDRAFVPYEEVERTSRGRPPPEEASRGGPSLDGPVPSPRSCADLIY